MKRDREAEASTIAELTTARAEKEVGVQSYEWSIDDSGSVIHPYERFADSAAALHIDEFNKPSASAFLAAVDATKTTVYDEPDGAVTERLAAWGPTYMAPCGGFSR